MKVLVTGATGFLGRNLLDELLARGHQVRGLVRKTGNINFLQKRNVEICYGDLTDKKSIFHAVKGSKLVYHCAAKVSDWGPFPSFYKINVEGTENLLRASLKERVERFIHVSSLTVLDITREHWESDENHPYPDKFFDSYTKTKVLAEKLVMRYYEKEGLPVSIIRPSIIWGPGDPTIFPRLVNLLKSGKFLFIGKSNPLVSLSYISNVVDALLLAGTRREAIGKIYNITDGEKVVFREFIAMLSGILHIDPPVKSIPFSLAYLIAYLMELWQRIAETNSPPLFTRYGVYLTSSHGTFDISRARNELGYEPRIGLKDGLEKTAPWLRELSGAVEV